MAVVLNALAELLRDTNRHTEAEPLYRRALVINEAAYGPDHPNVAIGLNNLGMLQFRLGDLSSAIELIERAHSIFQASLGDEHPNTQALESTIKQFDSVNEVLAKTLQAVDQATATFGGDSAQIIPSLNELARLYKRLGWFNKTEVLYRDALVMRGKQLEKNHPEIGESLCELATFLFQQGRIAEALPNYKHALGIYETNVEKSDDIPQQWFYNLAICHNQIAFHEDVPAENWLSAETHYRQAIAQYHQAGQDIESANSELNLQVMFHLSNQPVDVGRVKELTKILEQANDPRAGKGHDLL